MREPTIHLQAFPSPNRPISVTAFSAAPEYGASTVTLQAEFQGKPLPIFPPRRIPTEAEMHADPNLPFKLWNTPLFPIANRLREPMVVAGYPVRMPKNNQATGDAHHLHGLLFNRPSEKNHSIHQHPSGEERLVVRYPRCLRGKWTGECDADVIQWIQGGVFHYEIRALNSGSTPVPIGFGSHPYFQIPSRNPASARLKIPGRKAAELTNLQDVFPTGRLLNVESEARNLDFREPRPIEGLYLDNYWTDLLPDASGAIQADLIDVDLGVTYRIRARSPNIRGIQVYYPGKGDVVAIELVTHHPDPRREVWGDTETGIHLLGPGASADYRYEISVLPNE
jgi:aldose 1-epimerase